MPIAAIPLEHVGELAEAVYVTGEETVEFAAGEVTFTPACCATTLIETGVNDEPPQLSQSCTTVE